MGFRSLPLAVATALALSALEPLSARSGCAATLSANTPSVSVVSGGTQMLTLQSNSPGRVFGVIGSFSGGPPEPYFAQGGLYLARDRYMLLCAFGRSPFLIGGAPPAVGGHFVTTNALGVASHAVTVEPARWLHLVGQTVEHGVYTLDPLMLLPECGSNTVKLTFVP